MNSLAIWGIDFYQRHLSPRKGFTCAHLNLWSGVSCSQAVKRIVQEQGLFGGRGDIRARFAACREAAVLLASAMERPEGVSEERWEELTRRRGCKGDILDCNRKDCGRGLEFGACGIGDSCL